MNLQEGLIPFLIAATLGTTELGSIDPIDALADIAEKHDLWLHVDGAIGGFYALCDKMKKVFKGECLVKNVHVRTCSPADYVDDAYLRPQRTWFV